MKKSELVTCDICGKEVFARGLKSHIRLQHKSNTTVQVNKEKDIEYDGPPEFRPVTFEDLLETRDFYYTTLLDEKSIRKFVTWINKENRELDLTDILKHYGAFLLYGGKTEDEQLADD